MTGFFIPIWMRAGRRRSDRRGFTLIELLVVITIIGILASLAIPKLNDALDDGKKKSGRADAVALHVAFTRLYWASGSAGYPTVPATVDYAWLLGQVGPYLSLPATQAEANIEVTGYVRPDASHFTLTIKAKDRTGTTFTINQDGVS